MVSQLPAFQDLLKVGGGFWDGRPALYEKFLWIFHKISVTFDEQRTDEEKIGRALVEGGVTVQGKPAPVP